MAKGSLLMLSFHVLLHINFQCSGMWQKTSLSSFHPLHKNVILLTLIKQTSKGLSVLHVGKLINNALKCVQLHDK